METTITGYIGVLGFGFRAYKMPRRQEPTMQRAVSTLELWMHVDRKSRSLVNLLLATSSDAT